MDQPRARRITRELTQEEHDRLRRAQEQVAAELPELVARAQRIRSAYEENTVSGELRRAIHSGQRNLLQIAALIGISPLALDEFVAGEKPLPSDAIDRLAEVLGLRLQPAHAS